MQIIYVIYSCTIRSRAQHALFQLFFAAELEKFKCLMKSLPATVTAYLTLPLYTPLRLSLAPCP